MAALIKVSESSWIGSFTGLRPRQFGKLITALRRDSAISSRKQLEIASR